MASVGDDEKHKLDRGYLLVSDLGQAEPGQVPTPVRIRIVSDPTHCLIDDFGAHGIIRCKAP